MEIKGDTSTVVSQDKTCDNGVLEYCGEHLMTAPDNVPVHESMLQSKAYGDSK